MAHKKAGGSTSLGRDSRSQRLGVKLFAGQIAKPGMILIRQRGTACRPGRNVKRGKDDTLYAKTSGVVSFSKKKVKRYDGRLKPTHFIHIDPKE